MASTAPTLTLLLGSATPPGRFHRALTAASARAAARHPGLSVVTLDLAELAIPYADGRPPEGDTATLVDTIADADAVLLATPVYRGSLTGALKNALDHLPVPALRDTPVAIASMGASDHHFLGADRHLRDILTFFGAVVPPTSVYLTARDFTDGEPGEDALGRLDALIDAALSLIGSGPFEPPPLGAGRG
jgi:FMN reductase